METHHTKSESEYIKRYQRKGYMSSYIFKNDKLVDPSKDKSYNPNDISVVAEHRFEGMSNPSDLSILYVIETKNDSKGTILVGYGPTGNLELAEFFKAIPKSQYSNQENIDYKE